ncbi:Triple Functional Domain Protein [Manis pentadactyla]|nr:Triple Functional Domain Protein [Manis pentadactyla]
MCCRRYFRNWIHYASSLGTNSEDNRAYPLLTKQLTPGLQQFSQLYTNTKKSLAYPSIVLVGSIMKLKAQRTFSAMPLKENRLKDAQMTQQSTVWEAPWGQVNES